MRRDVTACVVVKRRELTYKLTPCAPAPASDTIPPDGLCCFACCSLLVRCLCLPDLLQCLSIGLAYAFCAVAFKCPTSKAYAYAILAFSFLAVPLPAAQYRATAPYRHESAPLDTRVSTRGHTRFGVAEGERRAPTRPEGAPQRKREHSNLIPDCCTARGRGGILPALWETFSASGT